MIDRAIWVIIGIPIGIVAFNVLLWTVRYVKAVLRARAERRYAQRIKRMEERAIREARYRKMREDNERFAHMLAEAEAAAKKRREYVDPWQKHSMSLLRPETPRAPHPPGLNVFATTAYAIPSTVMFHGGALGFRNCCTEPDGEYASREHLYGH